MMNVTVFLREGAKFMATDRPDIWDLEGAFEQISSMFSYLAGMDQSGEISTGGFALQKFIDLESGDVNYNLHRKILEFNIFETEEETSVYDWTQGSKLNNIGLEVPDPFVDNDE